MKDKYKYIYGPVPSWRLGRSLGVDPISTEVKTCPFNCIYCQLGYSISYGIERRPFVPVEEVVAEIESVPREVEIDYITFSGRGEPTLASNLGKMIDAIRVIRKTPIAVLTDASLIDLQDVRSDLAKADFVMAKLDAGDEETFIKVNQPAPGLTLAKIIEGLKLFRKEYRGRFALQMMFMEENRDSIEKMSVLARELSPDEVQLNTPLRPCGVQPLSRDEMAEVQKYFAGMKAVNVYEGLHADIKPISTKAALYRRGKRI